MNEMMLKTEGILRQVGVEFKPESDLLGAPGKMILSFEAVGFGLIRLELVYWRPWEREPIETYFVIVEMGLSHSNPTSTSDPPSPQLPSAFDWRNRNGVTPVKDQARCGSCWAFSTVGLLESKIRIKDGVIEDLSEQYLVSCNTEAGAAGVDYGPMTTMRGRAIHAIPCRGRCLRRNFLILLLTTLVA